MRTLRNLVAAAVVGGAAMAPAFGALLTFDLVWSPTNSVIEPKDSGNTVQVPANTASAKGQITFDSSLLPAPFQLFPQPLPDAAITALTVTVTGATAGNGTFGLADFNGFFFWSPAPLDLTKELIGQDLGNGCEFGDPSGTCGSELDAGDFNLFSPLPTTVGLTPSAYGAPPNGEIYFVLVTDGGLGDAMRLTSMAPAGVPEPGSLTLMGLALAAIAATRRRRPAADQAARG